MSKEPIEISTYLSHEVIERKIFVIRSKRVMIDSDLAELYRVPTKALIQAVKRNPKRFPPDFLWQLTKKEAELLRSQSVTSKGRGGRRYLPYCFTEQGLAMLSSVLNSERAIEVNIQIMRAFIRLREYLLTHKDLQKKIEEMERKYDQSFQSVFKAIKILLEDKLRRDKNPRRFGW